MTHTPGSYLADRRERAGFSLLDVALRVETVPAVSAATRAAWLYAIEAGLAPVRLSTALALARIEELAVDLGELGRLADQAETLVHFLAAPTLEECR